MTAETSKAGSIKRLFWTYGPDETPLDGVSRHYVDLNLHIETEHYAAGDSAAITICNDDGRALLTGHQTLALQAVVGQDGNAKLMNVFAGKTIEIGRVG